MQDREMAKRSKEVKQKAKYGTARLVSDATGYSIHYVRQVMQGVRKNTTISFALKNAHKSAVQGIQLKIKNQ